MTNKKPTPDNPLNDIETENRILHQAIAISDAWLMLESPDHKMWFISGAFEEITGYQPGQFDQQDIFRHLLDEQDYKAFRNRISKLRAKQPRYQLQFNIKTRDGNKRCIWHQAQKYHDDGKFAGWLSVNRDVTVSNASLLKRVCDNMNEAVFVGEIICNHSGAPVDYRTVMVNKAFEKQTGHKNHDIPGKRVREVFPHTGHEWIKRFGKVALDGKSAKFEDYDQNTGRYYELNCHQPVYGQFAVIFSDVTKQKNVEQKLRKSEHLYQSMVNTQKELICRFRPDTTLVFVNSAFCRVFNTPEEKVIGRKFTRFVPKDSHEVVVNHIRELIAEGGRKKNVHQVILPGNKMAWYEWMNYVLDSEGDDVEILAVGYDITDQYQTEMELLDTIRRFNIISEYSKTVYWEVDEHGLYKYVSEGCKNIYGYSNDELVGKMHFYDLHPEEEREDFKKRAFKVFAREDKFNDFQGKLLTKDGAIKWISTSGLPVYDQKGAFRGYRGSDMEITLRRKQQDIINSNIRQIHDYQSKLQRLNLALAESEENVKKDIAQFLHDEIGQVLSAMHIQLSFLDTLEDGAEQEQIFESFKDHLNRAIVQCREMTYELSPPILKKYGINEAIKWKLNEVQNNHGINTSFSSTIDKLKTDDKIKLMLFRIVVELINNVVKHAGATAIGVGIESEGKGVRFEVKDNGKGFDYDFQKDLSSNNSFGLFNIRERLSFLGGKLMIESGKKGTTAQVVLPEL